MNLLIDHSMSDFSLEKNEWINDNNSRKLNNLIHKYNGFTLQFHYGIMIAFRLYLMLCDMYGKVAGGYFTQLDIRNIGY